MRARSALSLGCGPNTSCARKLLIASAAVFMPVVPGVTFGYVRAYGMHPRKSACECACVCPVPPAAETCVCRGFAGPRR